MTITPEVHYPSNDEVAKDLLPKVEAAWKAQDPDTYAHMLKMHGSLEKVILNCGRGAMRFEGPIGSGANGESTFHWQEAGTLYDPKKKILSIDPSQLTKEHPPLDVSGFQVVSL